MERWILWILLIVYFLIGIFVGRLICNRDEFSFFIVAVWPIAVICLVMLGMLAIPIKLADGIKEYIEKRKGE